MAESILRSDPATEPAVRKAARRLIPLLGLMYFLSQLDRVNAGFAAEGMREDIGLTTAAFGLGAGLFFLGYCLLEPLSNMIQHRVGARLWLARIMISWGAVTAVMAAVQGDSSFYAIRILLGIAEAGFIPGVILYLTTWFPAEYRGRLTAQFYFAAPIAIIVGAPLSSWTISTLDGWFGLEGWRVMFLTHGVPTILVGLLVLFILPNRPRDAGWLNDSEIRALENALAQENDRALEAGSSHRSNALRDVRTYLVGAVLFANLFGLNAFSFFMPQVMTDFETEYGIDFSSFEVGLLTALPYAVAVIAMWFTGRASDRTGNRIGYSGVALAIGAVAVIAAPHAPTPVLQMTALSVVVAASLSALPILWQIPKAFLAGPAAAVGIGVIAAIANSSGFFAPALTGALREKTGNFTAGLEVIGCVMLLAVAILFFIKKTTERKEESSLPGSEPQ